MPKPRQVPVSAYRLTGPEHMGSMVPPVGCALRGLDLGRFLIRRNNAAESPERQWTFAEGGLLIWGRGGDKDGYRVHFLVLHNPQTSTYRLLG